MVVISMLKLICICICSHEPLHCILCYDSHTYINVYSINNHILWNWMIYATENLVYLTQYIFIGSLIFPRPQKQVIISASIDGSFRVKRFVALRLPVCWQHVESCKEVVHHRSVERSGWRGHMMIISAVNMVSILSKLRQMTYVIKVYFIDKYLHPWYSFKFNSSTIL